MRAILLLLQNKGGIIMPLRHYCSRCGSGCNSLTYGLCDSCFKKMGRKFEEVQWLDSDTEKEMMRKYGGGTIEEALVFKKWGKPHIDYLCGCGEIISKEQAEKTRERSADGAIYHCSSCENSRRRQLERSRKQDRKRFEKL